MASGATPAGHVPVLLTEVLDALAPQDGETFIDATFGAGGYTEALLEAARCRVIAFDRDPDAVRLAEDLVTRFAPRLTLINAPFSAMADSDAVASSAIHGVVFDIGVSSMQLDQAERGFSFLRDGPLDMRMSQEGRTAADVVNTFEAERLADILYELGEERRSRAIARAIVAARSERPFTRTKELADLVERVLRGRHEEGRHPATRTFQALRIFVNDELGELERGLEAAERVLAPGGRLAVVTFHSLEDRIAKRFLTARSGRAAKASRHVPERSIKLSAPSFRILNARPFTPQKGELDVNPRARSARLRTALRTEAPPWVPTAV